MKILIMMLAFLFTQICSTAQTLSPSSDSKNVTMSHPQTGEKLSFSAPPNCVITKSKIIQGVAYVILMRNQSGWGLNFEMIVAMRLKNDSSSDNRIEILYTDKDFRDSKSRKWIEDIREEDGAPVFLFAQVSRLHVPADVTREWKKFEEIKSEAN
jgi:hypothetical protein